MESNRQLSIQTLVSRARTLITTSGWWLIAIVCLLISQMLVGQRGLYFDDYFRNDPGYVPNSIRPLQSLLTALLLKPNWTHFEVWVRLFLTILIGLNAFLTGYLVYRLVKSRLAAVISIWLFLVPVFAFEGMLWLTAATLFLPEVLFVLLCWHCFYSSLRSEQQSHAYRWLCASIVCFTIMILFGEALVFAALAFIPFLALIAVKQRSTSHRQVIRLSAVHMIACLIITSIVYLALYRNNSFVFGSDRGSLTLSPGFLVNRVEQYVVKLQWMTVSPDWGQQLLIDTFNVGLITLYDHPKIALLFALTLGLLILVAWWWQDSDTGPDPASTAPPNQVATLRLSVILLAGSAIWFVTALFLPGILISRQILEYRMLYFPVAGAGVFIATLCLIVTRLLRYDLVKKLAILGSGLVVMLCTVCMVGYTQSFAVRSALDQAQLKAVLSVIPTPDPASPIYFVPYQLDEAIYDETDGISKALFGLFENEGPATFVLQKAYGDPNIQTIVGNRWSPMRFDIAADHGIADGQIKIQDKIVPINQVLLFTYRAGKVYVITHINISDANGTTHPVQFPITETLQSHGIPAIDTVQAVS